MTITPTARTLVFCTGYSPPKPTHSLCDEAPPYYSWNIRYRIWLESIKRSALKFDQILIVDDGSQDLPEWRDIQILGEDDEIKCKSPVVFYHFRNRLGRVAVSDFPGWVRSFFFASRYALANGFDRLIHIEADAFLITSKAIDVINGLSDGWTAFWCNRFKRPESGIQVIAGSACAIYHEWAMKPISNFTEVVIEKTLPFTNIEKGLVGDRYGEDDFNWIPGCADWCMQARPTGFGSYPGYFWWMPWFESAFPELKPKQLPHELIDRSDAKLAHNGLHYLSWLKVASAVIGPQTYFEIGTHTGSSLQMVSSDAVCVDPNFAISSNVIQRRQSTHFFQGTSDDFFADESHVKRLLPMGIDLAFLDGLHLFESLLLDFINTERLTSKHSVILLHDCLPLNARMAERQRREGESDEPESLRDFWTGDVWKILLVFRKYRPDLMVRLLDCPPTGLVACSNLDATSLVLEKNYSTIVSELEGVSLGVFGLRSLWQIYPTVDSAKTAASGDLMNRVLFPDRHHRDVA